MQRSQVLFLVKFFAVLVAAYLLIAWNPVNDRVIVPFTEAIATGSGALLNAIRIVTLYLLGAYQPRLFDLFHTAVWQVVIILAAIGFFLIWSARVAPTRVANRA